METMYDRLGDLLNETLEAGEIKFVKVEVEQKKPEKPQNESATAENNGNIGQTENQEEKQKESNTQSEPNENARARKNARPEYHRPENTGTIYHADDLGDSTHTQAYKPRSFIYKKITPELEKAYKLLDVPFNSTMEDLKKAYKDKLKYYHPDRHADNETLQKVATDKTRQVVEAYNLIVKFLEE